jgi:signal peptidase I, bacterial type
LLFDDEKTDYDDIIASGADKEISRAEKKAAKKALKEDKKREKMLREAEKLGFTPDMLGEDFGREQSLDEILKGYDEKNKASEETPKAESEEKSDEKSEEPAAVSSESTSEEEVKPEESEEEEKKKRKRRHKKGERDPQFNVVKELLNTVVYMGVVILLAFLIVTFVGQKVVVSGQSMESTLQNEDSLWVDKLSYTFGEPERFDVIVFPYKKGSDILFIKRVIGLPGETVQIQDGNIYINGELLEENYGLETINDPGIAGSKVTLAHDEYFVLGDNRNNSNDSRRSDVGNIKKENIIGKAVFRIAPASKFGKIH